LANVAAAVDRKRLSGRDSQLLQPYAGETCNSYCPGCTHFCQSAFDREVSIGKVMRYLMYAGDYGNPERASRFEKRKGGHRSQPASFMRHYL